MSAFLRSVPRPNISASALLSDSWGFGGRRTLRAEELARDVESLAPDHDNLLAVQKLLGDRAGQATEEMSLAINHDLQMKAYKSALVFSSSSYNFQQRDRRSLRFLSGRRGTYDWLEGRHLARTGVLYGGLVERYVGNGCRCWRWWSEQFRCGSRCASVVTGFPGTGYVSEQLLSSLQLSIS